MAPRAATPRPAAAPAATKQCDLQIGFFGALTGDAANLGINIKNGADLAVKQYNKKHKDCQVKLKQFDSQGSETQAPALAKTAIDDKTVIGIVGPAFSGESKAADPAFNEAGLTTITPSATNPALAKNGWKTFFRALGNDASQGPAAAKYIKDTSRPPRCSSWTTRRSTARAWPTSSSPTSVRWSSAPTRVQQKQTDFSASVTKVKASGAQALFYGGYYAEAGLLVKQLKDAGWKGTVRRR